MHHLMRPKRKFCKFCNSVNSILSKGLGVISEEILLYLLKVKCLPILLYGTESCDLPKRCLCSFDFCLVRFMMKIFRSNNKDYILNVLDNMGFPLPSVLVDIRRAIFTSRISLVDNCFL